MPSVVDLLGDSLLDKDGKNVSTSSLIKEGKVVGLYFSAHWCEPCRGFTPKLHEFYENYRKTHGEEKLDIVFVSSDKDQEGFTEYVQEMPWLSLPYEDRQRKAKLCKRFRVQAIPSLTFVEAKSGELITTDGRNHVLDDADGKEFPWYRKPVSELLKGPITTKNGDLDSSSALAGKVLGLYFSAHWCPPCRSFTPGLIEIYKKLKEENKNFEVVFVSSDRADSSFNEYYNTMPWMAIPYGDDRVQLLTKHFGVQGIPTLILLDEKNEIITTNGRQLVTKDPEGKEFPWPAKPVEELNEITAPLLNESACIVYFTDGEEEHIAQAYKLLNDHAQSYIQQQKQSQGKDNELPELNFLIEGPESDEIADSLRSFGSLDDRSPLVTILDITGMQVFVYPEEEITSIGISSMIEDFKHEKLTFCPLGR